MTKKKGVSGETVGIVTPRSLERASFAHFRGSVAGTDPVMVCLPSPWPPTHLLTQVL